MTRDTTTTRATISRRTMLTGVGAVALFAGAGLSTPPAHAAPSLIRARNAKAQKVLDIAAAELGERGTSKGYSKYNYGKNWRSPMPGDHHTAWCAMFLSWCFDQNWSVSATTRAIGHQVGRVYPAGWSATWLWREHLRGNNQWVGWKAAEPGDLVFFKFGEDEDATNHVAMVWDPSSANTYELIEGNMGPSKQERAVRRHPYTRDSSLVAVYRPAWSAL